MSQYYVTYIVDTILTAKINLKKFNSSKQSQNKTSPRQISGVLFFNDSVKPVEGFNDSLL